MTALVNGKPNGLEGGTENDRLREGDRFRALVEASRDVITIVDSAGTVRYASPSFVATTGHRPEEVIGKSTFLHAHPDDVSRVRARIDEIMAGTGPGEPITFRFQHRNGSWKVLEAVATNRLDDPAVRGLVVSSRDVTQQRSLEESMHKLEEQFRQAQRMEAVGRLAGGVAHDFNNFLTAIVGYTELLATGLGSGSHLHENVEEILKAAGCAASLTRQLLALSRRQILEPKLLDLNGVVENMRNILRRLVGEDVALATLLEPGLGCVRGDAGQIEQVILNLAVNARDAMPRGGNLTIETRSVDLDGEYALEHIGVRPGRHVLLAVSDTGIGMDVETRSRVFEPFFTTKASGQGTGLGLSTVYGIVKQSGGSIWIYSEPGRGTTFKIYLPCAEGAPEGLWRAASARPARGTETVLLVEDDPSVRALSRRILESYGYSVIETAGAEDALDFARRNDRPIHLLLTDVVMPEMGGAELASRLQSLRPEVRVLYMSGYTDDAVVRLGLVEGKGSFLQKPFTPASLAAGVREVLDA
jgi:PAS domain S-box-containing protein